jgi:hypothetical protein
MAPSVAPPGPCAKAATLAASHNTNSFDFKKPPKEKWNLKALTAMAQYTDGVYDAGF